MAEVQKEIAKSNEKNLIGESFDNYVQDQIVIRQSKLGLGLQDLDIVKFKNTNTSFIRLTSGVDVTADVLKNSNLSNKYSSSELAKVYRLGSISGSLTKGIGYNDTSVYGFASNSSYGYVPMPGITSAEVKALNRGSLREAVVQITCHNLEQFQIIELLYLRLKYSILLEWGHSVYFDNKGNLIQSLHDLSSTFLNGGITQQRMLDLIREERIKSDGNYDAFFGLVTNFSWTLRHDGGYDITMIARSTGDIIESLKINAKYYDKSTEDQSSKPLNASSQPGFIGKAEHSSLHRVLSKIPTQVYRNRNYAHGVGNDLTNYTPMHTGNLEWISGLKSNFFRTTDIENPGPYLTYNEVQRGEFEKLSDGVSFNAQYFMKLGTLCRIIESFLSIYDTSKSSTESGSNGSAPILKIDYNFNNNYCLTFPRHCSLDPKVSVIPVPKEIDDKKINGQHQYTQTSYIFLSIVPPTDRKGAGHDPLTNSWYYEDDPNFSKNIYQSIQKSVGGSTNSSVSSFTKDDKISITYITDPTSAQDIASIKTFISSPEVLSVDPTSPSFNYNKSVAVLEKTKKDLADSSKTKTNSADYDVDIEYIVRADNDDDLGYVAVYKYNQIDANGNETEYLNTRATDSNGLPLGRFYKLTRVGVNADGTIQPLISTDDYGNKISFNPTVGDLKKNNVIVQTVNATAADPSQGIFESWKIYQSTVVTYAYRSLNINYNTKSTTGIGFLSALGTQFRYSGQNTVGRHMHIYVNFDYIAKTLDNNINVETGALDLYKFLKELMKGIQNSLGNVNNFEVIYNEEQNSYRIIDNTLIPGINDKPKLKTVAKFNPNVLKPGYGSFIKNVGLTTKLSNNFAMMTTVGAQANGNVVGENATMLSKWNVGLTDRIITNRNNLNGIINNSGSKTEEKYISNVNALISYNSLIENYNISDNDIATFKTGIADLFKAELGQFTEENYNQGIGFLPFDLELSMLGLSGPRIYETYTIDETVLPEVYKNKIQFICTGVSHKISNGEWTTVLNSICGPNYNDKPSKSMPAVNNLKVTSVVAKPDVTSLNQTQKDNLHILNKTLKEKGFKTVASRIAVAAVCGKETTLIPKSEISYKTTTVENIRKIFGDKISDLTDPEVENLKQDPNPALFFNYVYRNESKNRAGTDDGYTFRGRGFNQITSRGNYEAITNFSGVDYINSPDKLNEVQGASNAAAWYFGVSGIDYLNKFYKQLGGTGNFKDATNVEAAIKAAAWVNAGIGRSIDNDVVQQSMANALAWKNILENTYNNDSTLQ
jgi:predicted chitinase